MFTAHATGSAIFAWSMAQISSGKGKSASDGKLRLCLEKIALDAKAATGVMPAAANEFSAKYPKVTAGPAGPDAPRL
jgi:hypothetical protein